MSTSDAFSGPTAAVAWELPLPVRWMTEERLFVTCGGHGRIRRPGVVARRKPGSRPVEHNGLPVLDPVDTWLSLAPVLQVWDLTAVADRIVSGTLTTPPLSTPRELAERLATAGRFPGIGAARSALADVRVGAWSRPETLLRLLLLRAGLPELDLNVEVALDDGRWAYPDLAWSEFRIAIEYDGRWHNEKRQRRHDGERQERLVDAGWIVVRVQARELFDSPSAVVARMMRRLASRGARLGAVQGSRMPRFER